jgi:hypothetical protein
MVERYPPGTAGRPLVHPRLFVASLGVPLLRTVDEKRIVVLDAWGVM